jgi:small conductance mechanosensitive channel
MDSVETQIQTFYDKAITVGTEYGGQLLLALIVLVVGLWVIGKLGNVVRRQSIKGLPDET